MTTLYHIKIEDPLPSDYERVFDLTTFSTHAVQQMHSPAGLIAECGPGVTQALSSAFPNRIRIERWYNYASGKLKC